MSEWISVKDRLPDCGKDVLAWSNFYGRMLAVVARIDEEGKWSFGYVTHWMPLPEPPKEG